MRRGVLEYLWFVIVKVLSETGTKTPLLIFQIDRRFHSQNVFVQGENYHFIQSEELHNEEKIA